MALQEAVAGLTSITSRHMKDAEGGWEIDKESGRIKSVSFSKAVPDPFLACLLEQQGRISILLG